MTYEEREAQVPREIRGDSAWRVKAYRLGLFLGDLAAQDAAKLSRTAATRDTADQLSRAASRISSNVIEGYSRDTGKGRSTYYEYALGSARESRDWYYKVRSFLGSAVVTHRITLCTDIIRLTLKMIATERRSNRRASGPN